MRVTLDFHSTTFKLNIDYLTNGIKQLHAVVEETEVFLMTLFRAVIILPFHTV